MPVELQTEVEETNSFEGLLEQCKENDRRKFVQLAIQQLKDDERIYITLYYLNELQVNEIHEMTRISVANIKVLLHRGRKNLYKHLEQLLKQEIKSLI